MSYELDNLASCGITGIPLDQGEPIKVLLMMKNKSRFDPPYVPVSFFMDAIYAPGEGENRTIKIGNISSKELEYLVKLKRMDSTGVLRFLTDMLTLTIPLFHNFRNERVDVFLMKKQIFDTLISVCRTEDELLPYSLEMAESIVLYETLYSASLNMTSFYEYHPLLLELIVKRSIEAGKSDVFVSDFMSIVKDIEHLQHIINLMSAIKRPLIPFTMTDSANECDESKNTIRNLATQTLMILDEREKNNND